MKTFAIFLVSCFMLYLIFVIGARICLDAAPGMDFYTYAAENKRYEFLSTSGDIALRDNEKNIGLAGHIEKYIQREPYVYIIRGQSFSSASTLDGTTYYYDEDPFTWEYIEYTDINDIPLYMVLNYETGEVTKYMSFEEMPEGIRAIFEEPVTEECLEDRTCYDKTMVIKGKVLF